MSSWVTDLSLPLHDLFVLLQILLYCWNVIGCKSIRSFVSFVRVRLVYSAVLYVVVNFI